MDNELQKKRCNSNQQLYQIINFVVMRKFISFIVVLMLCSTTFAQLRVASNGNVTINLASTVTPLSPLTIGGTGDSYAKGFFLKDSTTYYIRSKIAGKVYGNWGIPFLGENTVMSGLWHAGVKGASESSTARNYGRAYGVLGCASNATSGYNYGVFGTVGGTNNGAGVVGTVNGNIQVSVPGIYAGYFLGNVVSTGTVTAVSFVTGSDPLFYAFMTYKGSN